MAAPKLRAVDVPTLGPWLVRGEAGGGGLAANLLSGVTPGIEGQQPGWPYFIRQSRPTIPGACPLHRKIGAGRLASDIPRLADAKLMAVAPDLADALLRLLIAPDLRHADLDPRTRLAIATGWDLLVRVAPHLEI